jgi:hypothetical protein
VVSGSDTARNDSTNSSRDGPSGGGPNGLCERGSNAASSALASPSSGGRIVVGERRGDLADEIGFLPAP